MTQHYCYILHDATGKSKRTYNGYTVDPERRLKQHNGLLKGVAKATRCLSTWTYLAIVRCEEFTKHTALSFEWHVKYPTGKRPRPTIFSGYEGRLQGLKLVFAHPKFKDMQFKLWIDPGLRSGFCDSFVAENVIMTETKTDVELTGITGITGNVCALAVKPCTCLQACSPG